MRAGIRPFIVHSSTPLEMVKTILNITPHYPRHWSDNFIDLIGKVSFFNIIIINKGQGYSTQYTGDGFAPNGNKMCMLYFLSIYEAKSHNWKFTRIRLSGISIHVPDGVGSSPGLIYIVYDQLFIGDRMD